MIEPRGPETAACGCVEGPDSRTCYELHEYGYSPIPHEETEWTREWGLRVDEHGDCDCDCHVLAEDDDDY